MTIVSKPPNAAAKREALRLLAADATSAPLFEKILRDKNEMREIRQISASALHALKPEKLQEHAREMLLDKSEYDEIQGHEPDRAHTVWRRRSRRQRQGAAEERRSPQCGKAPAKYKQSARRFLSKYGR